MYLPLFSCYVKPNVKSRKFDDSQIDKKYKYVNQKLRTKFLVHNFIYNLITDNQSVYNVKNPYFYVRDYSTEETYNKKTYYLLFISTIGQSITRMYFMNRSKSIEYTELMKACLFTVKDDIIYQLLYDEDFYASMTYRISLLSFHHYNAHKLYILIKVENKYNYKKPIQDFIKLLRKKINDLKDNVNNEKLGYLIKSLGNTIVDSINKSDYDFSVDGEILNIQNKNSGRIDFGIIFMFSLVLSKLYFIIVIELFDSLYGHLNKTIYLISEVKKDRIITSCHRKFRKEKGEKEYQTFFTDLVSSYDIREVYNILTDVLGVTTAKIKIER